MGAKKFLRRLKSLENVKQIDMSDILNLAIQSGISLKEALIEVKKALTNDEISTKSLDPQAQKIFGATHLAQNNTKSTQNSQLFNLEFEKRIVEDIQRIEQDFAKQRQTYQEQEMRKAERRMLLQQERDKQRSMSPELHAHLNPKLKLRRG